MRDRCLRTSIVRSGSSSGGATSGIGTWWSGPSSSIWNEAAMLKICCPCWIATTRRLLKLAPSAAAIDLVDDRCVEVAAAQEIGVQRVHRAALDRAARAMSAWPSTCPPNTCGCRCRGSRRGTGSSPGARARAGGPGPREAGSFPGSAALRAHSETPSRFCMIGLVVVYWRCTFLAGLMCSAIANAASAASWKPLRTASSCPDTC